MANKADIHMHSTASDGGYPPSELMKMCADAGLGIVALTDHDTTSGLPDAREAADKYGMRFINGIELSTRFKERSVDILGYGININDTGFQNTLSFHRRKREERMERMVEKCRENGLSISIDDVKAEVTGHTYSRPHLAKALIKKGTGDTVGEIFDRYIGHGRPCYVTKEDEMTPREAIQLIQHAGGVAIIAHPVYYKLDDYLVSWFTDYGVDGIEVYHRDHDKEAVERYLQIAQQAEKKTGNSVFKTGGSDFHHESFGREGEELGLTKLPYSEAERLWNHLKDR